MDQHGDIAANAFPAAATASASGLSPGNIRLIACTSVIGGIVLLVFLAYVVHRLLKGDELADILKLRRTRMTDEEKNGSVAAPFIFYTHRFSVRSSRYTNSRIGSMYSSKSKRAQMARSGSGRAMHSNSAYKQYSDAYLIAPPTARRPEEKRPPMPALSTIPSGGSSSANDGMRTFLLNSSVPSTPVKPEMAKLSDAISITSPTSPESHGAAEEVALNKPSSRCMTITTKPVFTAQSPVTASKFSSKKPRVSPADERWSWTNPDAPATPKLYIDTTQAAGARVARYTTSSNQQMDPIDENKVVASPESKMPNPSLKLPESTSITPPASPSFSAISKYSFASAYRKWTRSPRHSDLGPSLPSVAPQPPEKAPISLEEKS